MNEPGPLLREGKDVGESTSGESGSPQRRECVCPRELVRDYI